MHLWLYILLGVLLPVAGEPMAGDAGAKDRVVGPLGVRSLEMEPAGGGRAGGWVAPAESPRRARLVTSDGAEEAAPAEISWAFVRIAGMQENRDALEAREGWWELPMPEGLRGEGPGADGGEGALRQAGVSGAVGVVGVDLRPRVVEVDAAALREFIRERGVIAGGELPRGGGEQLVKVRRVESVKAIFGAGMLRPPGGDAGAGEVVVSEATSKTGQAVEIRPLMDPALTPVGGDIAVRVYAGGGAAANARVRAVHIASGEVQEVACAETGIGLFRLSKAGVWRVELHVLREEGDEERPREWVLYSGVLTFAAGDGEAAK